MDSVDPWQGVDRDAVSGMSADLDIYMALMEEICKCEGTCTCDDSLALAAALNPVAIQV